MPLTPPPPLRFIRDETGRVVGIDRERMDRELREWARRNRRARRIQLAVMLAGFVVLVACMLALALAGGK